MPDVDPVGGAVAMPGMAGRTGGESGAIDQGLSGSGHGAWAQVPSAPTCRARFSTRMWGRIRIREWPMTAPGGVGPTDPTTPRP